MKSASVPWLALVACAASLAPQGLAHNPAAQQDTHPYYATWGDVLVSCKLDWDHDPFPGPLKPVGDVVDHSGGGCFDFGTDVSGGTVFRLRIDDDHGQNVGGVTRIVSSSNVVVQPNTPYCGRYPVDGTFAPVPPSAFRLWYFTMVAQSPLHCLGYGMVGLPGTKGTVTIETG